MGWSPDIHDLGYYILETMTEGSELHINELMDVNGNIEATYIDLPRVPVEEDVEYEFHSEDEPAYYTNGAQLVVGELNDETVDLGATEDLMLEGEEYIGYYHVHIDEDTGDVYYMSGEEHTEDPHYILYPMVGNVEVAIGDVQEYTGNTPTSYGMDPNKPFYIEKYVRIWDENGSNYYTPTEAVEIIKGNDAAGA